MDQVALWDITHTSILLAHLPRQGIAVVINDSDVMGSKARARKFDLRLRRSLHWTRQATGEKDQRNGNE